MFQTLCVEKLARCDVQRIPDKAIFLKFLLIQNECGRAAKTSSKFISVAIEFSNKFYL